MKENNSYDKEIHIALNGTLNDNSSRSGKYSPHYRGVINAGEGLIIWVYTWRVWPLSRKDFSRAIPAMTHRPI